MKGRTLAWRRRERDKHRARHWHRMRITDMYRVRVSNGDCL